MGRYITTTGTSGVVLRTVSANFNATVNDRILANSSGGAFTITLPVSTTLLENDTIQIIDVGGAALTNNITIARNGALIQGASDDLVLDLNNASVTLIYTGVTYGWVYTAV
jgi:hypothetical protein